MKRISTAIMLGCMLLLPTLLGAQTTAPAAQKETPESVAQRALAAMKDSRLADFAKEMHPDALKQFRETMLSVVDLAEKQGQAAQVMSLFANVRAIDDLRKLDAPAFFTAFLEGVVRIQPRLRDAFRGMTAQMLGHVTEGPDVVHVVYRGTVTAADLKVSRMAVMSLKAKGDSWGMLMLGDLDAAVATLKRQFGAPQ